MTESCLLRSDVQRNFLARMPMQWMMEYKIWALNPPSLKAQHMLSRCELGGECLRRLSNQQGPPAVLSLLQLVIRNR